jgi:hypothetical protein
LTPDDPILNIPRLRQAEEACRRAILLLAALPPNEMLSPLVLEAAASLADALGAWNVAKYGPREAVTGDKP